MKDSFAAFSVWLRVQFFRLWTAAAVLAAFGYAWFERPEYLTWWKRTIDGFIETVCGALPYPWGDRIEATIGNFGVWVQLTLAILAARAVLGLGMIAGRAAWRRRQAAKSRGFERRI